MTPSEILTTIRGKIAWWRKVAQTGTYRLVSTFGTDAHTLSTLLDDLDPDRIDAHYQLRRDLIRDLFETGIQNIMTDDRADALLAKGWRK